MCLLWSLWCRSQVWCYLPIVSNAISSAFLVFSRLFIKKLINNYWLVKGSLHQGLPMCVPSINDSHLCSAFKHAEAYIEIKSFCNVPTYLKRCFSLGTSSSLFMISFSTIFSFTLFWIVFFLSLFIYLFLLIGTEVHALLSWNYYFAPKPPSSPMIWQNN